MEKDVQSMFESFGTIRKISIPIDRFTQRNKGFVFVEYEERRDAEGEKERDFSVYLFFFKKKEILQ